MPLILLNQIRIRLGSFFDVRCNSQSMAIARVLVKRNNSMNFGQNEAVFDVKLKISVMTKVFGFVQ